MNFNAIIQAINRFGTWVINTLDYHFVYKRHYKKLLSISPVPQVAVSADVRERHQRKWKALSSHYFSDTDLKLFSRYIGEDENILPEEISHNVIEPILNPIKFRPFYEDKNMFDKILPEGYLPKTFFRRIKGTYYDAEYKLIDSIEHFIQSTGILNSGCVVKPTIGSSSGKGVKVYKDRIPTISELEESYKGDFIVQEALLQHPALSSLNPTSINTLRLLAYRSPVDERVHILNGCVRVGKKGSFLDNAHAGGLVVGIKDDGALQDYAVDQYGNRYDFVNDVNLKAEKVQIPEYETIKDFASNVAHKILHHRLLSLDIAVTQDVTGGGILPCLIEYNISSLGTWVWQYANKSVFNDCTDEIITYCRKHKKETLKMFGIRN